MNFLFNNTNTNPYLSVYTVGYEETQPSHSYGPAVRSGYMLHYIYKGRGTFTCQGKIYSLKAGDFFLSHLKLLSNTRPTKQIPGPTTGLAFVEI